jgi:hypothetical protein
MRPRTDREVRVDNCYYGNDPARPPDAPNTESLECSFSRIADALEIIAEAMSAPEREKRARLRKLDREYRR